MVFRRPGEKPPRKKWLTAGDLVKTYSFKEKLPADRLSILNSVWEKELGNRSRLWELEAVKAGTIYVKTRSSAAAYELHMQASSLVRSLNKYFNRPWIRSIRPSRTATQGKSK